MAGLPGSSAMVSVGPPKSPRGDKPIPVRVVRTMLAFCPLVSPPEPPVPIRLYALPEDTPAGPAMSSGVMAGPMPAVLRATIELIRATVPESMNSPPPKAVPASTTLLYAIVVLCRVRKPPLS